MARSVLPPGTATPRRRVGYPFLPHDALDTAADDSSQWLLGLEC